MKKVKILFFGNPLVRKDSLIHAIIGRLKKELPKAEFEEAESSELHAHKELNILDVADGIDEVTLINEVDKLDTGKIYSLHDFDLAYNLKLMKKFGILKKVNIIAVPSGMDEKRALNGAKRIIKSSLF
jgi:Ni,Fe-hydrogenase maturation factor